MTIAKRFIASPYGAIKASGGCHAISSVGLMPEEVILFIDGIDRTGEEGSHHPRV